MVSISSQFIKKIHYLSDGAMLIQNNNVETLYCGNTDSQGSLIALIRFYNHRVAG